MTYPVFEQALARYSSDCALLLNSQGVILHANPAALSLMEARGLPDLTGTRWLDWWEAPEHDSATQALVAARAGEARRFKGFAYTLKRTPKWWDVQLIPLEHTAGEPGLLLALACDVTELHVRQQQIQELNTWLEQRVEQRTQESMRANYQLNNALQEIRDLYDNAPCGYFSLSAQGRFVAVNLTAQQWLGRQQGDMVGQLEFRTLLAPQDWPRFEVLRNQLLGARVPDDAEFTLHRPDGGSFVALLQAKAVFDFQGRFQHSRFSMMDVTERHKTQQALEELNVALQSTVRQLGQANAELESFSYSVSHDLRAPLRRIAQFADMARGLLEAEPALKDSDLFLPLDGIQESARHMTRLIQGLLDFSRMGRKALQVMPLDMASLIREVRRTLQPEEAGREVVWTVAPDFPQVMGDPILIRQVWSNLLSNALKYSRNQPMARIDLGWHRCGETHHEFFVRDNGSGFPSHMKDRLFGVFQRLHSATEFEGNGIGLALSRRIVERHEGTIRAEGAEGQGCTFYFTLPKMSPAASDAGQGL